MENQFIDAVCVMCDKMTIIQCECNLLASFNIKMISMLEHFIH